MVGNIKNVQSRKEKRDSLLSMHGNRLRQKKKTLGVKSVKHEDRGIKSATIPTP